MYRILFFLLFCSFQLIARQPQVPAIIQVAEKEIKRTMDGLKDKPNPPYFISYYITETQSYRLSATNGVIETKSHDSTCLLDIQVRVGSYKFDNTHLIRGNPLNFNINIGRIQLPFTDDERAIANTMWFATDKAYKNAIERYEKALTNSKVKVKEEDTSADFSIEKPIVAIENGQLYKLNLDNYQGLVKRLSAKFATHKWILNSSVSFFGNSIRKIIVTSEGTKIQTYENYFYIFVNASTKADDGMNLPLYRSFYTRDPLNMPNEKEIEVEIDKLIDLLSKLRNAPYADVYSGPAMLSGRAAGVFFHEIFGHRVEGHREKDPNSSQTFKKSIGQKILPDFINIIFDPTSDKLNNTPIAGYYVYDDEGVPAQKVEVVKNGVFSNFLMSRTPIEGFSNSNGHGRKASGYTAVSRQSNLIVQSSRTKSIDELKQELRKIAKEQGKEYGLFFDDVSGGFTFTSRSIPNAFNVTPLVVYKVFVDGRPDELVRGVDLIGTPLTTFANILAVGNDMGIFNGICGAESGGVPVSACSPSLLVSRIEVQKKLKSQAKPPILPAP